MARHISHFDKRRSRTRYRIASTAQGRPRLSVFRSGKHIYAQVIDDKTAATLVTASTNEKEGKAAKTWNLEAATLYAFVSLPAFSLVEAAAIVAPSPSSITWA